MMQRRDGGWARVLGMNARNLFVTSENPPGAIRTVNNKYETKAALTPLGVPVVPTITVVRDRWDLEFFDWNQLPAAWALKPNTGGQGKGILLARDRAGEDWVTASGRVLTRPMITEHIRTILDGEFSLEGNDQDWVLFEPLIIPHPAMAELVPFGLPDIRVICYHAQPVLAMTRLPTKRSEGRANLHQGAVGAGIDLETGRVVRALAGREAVVKHPDTGHSLVGATIPFWPTILTAAEKCGPATGLGYTGVDIVIDAQRGPLVIEVNARPGLEIQNVTGVGLMERIQALRAEPAQSSV